MVRNFYLEFTNANLERGLTFSTEQYFLMKKNLKIVRYYVFRFQLIYIFFKYEAVNTIF